MRAADGGWSGSNISWTLDDNGVLLINGKGDMKSYDGTSLPPWHSYSSSIKSVIIKNGVTSIDKYFERFVEGKCTFGEINVDLCVRFMEYLQKYSLMGTGYVYFKSIRAPYK